MDNLEKELSEILRDTGEHITENYLDMFFEIFDDLKIGPDHPPVSVEVLNGIAAALAQASGYRVILQADIKEGKPNTDRTIGYKDIIVAEP